MCESFPFLSWHAERNVFSNPFVFPPLPFFLLKLVKDNRNALDRTEVVHGWGWGVLPEMEQMEMMEMWGSGGG